MLLGADKTGFGLENKSASNKKTGASPLFICISTALMIAVNIRTLGPVWAGFMVALCVMILYSARAGIFSRLLRQPILILLPCFFVLSCLWSDEFTISLSLGVQTLLVALTAVTIAQRTTNRQLLLIIFLATSITCVGCILHGGMGPSASGMVLIGFLGSKDAMGLFAYSGVMASIAIIFDRERSLMIRAVAIVMALVESKIAISVHATTALISLGFGITLFLATYLILSRFKFVRWISYFLIFLMMMSVIVFGSDIVQLFLETTTHNLGKDTTLTGRTVLWEKALALFENSPLLGHGYRAYWAGSSLDAHQMLAMMNVSDGRGFHFHEQYLEVLADTGIFGFTILLATFVLFTKRIWRSALVNPSCFTAYSFATLVVYLVRWMFETAFLPFSFDMMILYGLAAAAMRQPEKSKQLFP